VEILILRNFTIHDKTLFTALFTITIHVTILRQNTMHVNHYSRRVTIHR